MKDVALAAGVHQTTVSRALRNDPRIPEATRQRIRRLAARLGYTPHPLVSALIALRRSRHRPRSPVTLAFVVPTGRDGRRYQPHQYTYEAHLAGARSAAEQQGYQIQLFPLDSPGMNPRRLNEIISTRNLPGLIIGSLPDVQGQFRLDWERFCTVVIEYTFAAPAFDRVVHDSYHGMRRVMAECRLRGLRRVGLVLTATGHARTEHLNGAAFWVEQKASDEFAPVPPLALDGWDPAAFAAWYQRHQVEVVVTSNALLPDLMAWCKGQRLRPGRKIQLINVNASHDGPISGVYQDAFAIGATAARMVMDKIARNERGIPLLRQTVLTEGRWVPGTTLRAPDGLRRADV